MPRERNSANGSSGSITARKWAYAEKALQYAEEAIEGLVKLMRGAGAENVRLGAMKEILDRSLGKAPAHIDITALRHTDIVYQSAEELRAELRKAIIEEGVPEALLDLTVEPLGDDEE